MHHADLTYTPVAQYTTKTYAYKGFGFFKASGSPLRLEIANENGSVVVVPIRDLQSILVTGLLAMIVVARLAMWLGRSD